MPVSFPYAAGDSRTVRVLYRQMPGAPMPEPERPHHLTGLVEGNEHWNFCAAIVDLIREVEMSRAGG